jgi:hypothetical protein
VARIEATKAYRQYVEKPKTSQQRERLELALELLSGRNDPEFRLQPPQCAGLFPHRHLKPDPFDLAPGKQRSETNKDGIVPAVDLPEGGFQNPQLQLTIGIAGMLKGKLLHEPGNGIFNHPFAAAGPDHCEDSQGMFTLVLDPLDQITAGTVGSTPENQRQRLSAN